MTAEPMTPEQLASALSAITCAQIEAPEDTADSIIAGLAAGDLLYAEVKRLRCTDPIECGHEAALGQAEALADQTMLRSLKVDPRGMTLDLAPPPGLVLSMVETAKQILGDAPNYTETPVTLTVSAAGEYERYAFVVQRVGKTTPHEAREQAEAERDRLRAELATARKDAAKWAAVEPTIRRAADHGHDAYAELMELAEPTTPAGEVSGG